MVKQIKTVTFVCNRAWPYRGGVEKHVRKLIENLSEFDIDLISSFPKVSDSSKYYPVKTRLIVLDRFSIFRNLLIGLNPRVIYSIVKADVTHYHDYSTILGWGLWGFFLRFIMRRRQFITFHGWEGKFPLSKKVILVRRIIAIMCEGSIAIGGFIPKFYGTSHDIISYGGVDSQPESTEIPADNRVIYFVGRLANDSGFLLFLQAFVNLRDLNLVDRFVVYGSGPLEIDIDSYTGVEWKGEVDEPFLDVPIQSIVFASGYLGMLEAFSRSCRLVSIYDNPLKECYLKSFPNWENVFWVCGSVEELVSAVVEAKIDERKFERARETAIRMSWLKMSEDYISLWEKK